jgi:mannose-6-phosphate isomerase
MALAPIILPSNQFDHFYRGGNRIGVLRNGPGGPMRPEEWIAATTTRFGEKEMGLSLLPDGEFLRDAINAAPEQWLGKEHVAAFGTRNFLTLINAFRFIFIQIKHLLKNIWHLTMEKPKRGSFLMPQKMPK